MCNCVIVTSRHHLVAGVYSLKTLASHVGSLPTLLADDVLTVDNVSVGGNRTIVSGCSVHYNSGRNKDQILVVHLDVLQVNDCRTNENVQEI